MTVSDAGVRPILSTPAQIALEERAARIFALPPVVEARRALPEIAASFRQYALPTGRETAVRAMESFAFAYILHNLNTDAARPAVLWDQNPERRRGDVVIPGSCCKGNNPDNIYRRVPLDPAYRYELRGRRNGRPAPDMTFSVLPDTAHQESWQQTMIALEDVEADADGSFVVTLDADPANGRPNHLQLAPGAVRLTIRESMIDWANETPLTLEIERVDGAAPAPAFDDAAEAARMAPKLEGFVRHWLGYNDRSFYRGEANVLPPAAMPKGGLLTQISSMAHFDIAEDEALVIRVDRLGAAYLSLVAMDPWMRAAEYRTRTGSLNYGQMAGDGDDWFTAVLSLADPGVHNWIDPEGFRQGAFQVRWQALPPGVSVEGRQVSEIRKVKLSELSAHLPAGMKTVTASERAAQLSARLAAHDRRLAI